MMHFKKSIVSIFSIVSSFRVIMYVHLQNDTKMLVKSHFLMHSTLYCFQYDELLCWDSEF